MKKITALLLSVLCVLCLASCGTKKADEPSIDPAVDRLGAIKQKGYLEVCTEPYFAPNEFIDVSKTGQDQYQGMDIELAKYIADKIGVELKIVPLEFGAVLAGIAEGKYDLAISALAYSPSRAESMAMSKGYYFGGDGYGIVCRAEDVDKYQTIEDVQQAVVITQSGSVQEAMYKLYVGTSKEFKLTSSMTDTYLAVQEGKADVGIVACSAAQLYADANQNKLAVPALRFDVSEELTGTRVGACLDGTDSLMEVVNECIDELLADGTMQKWHDEAEAYAKKLGVD